MICNRTRWRNEPRRGMALPLVLICLALVMALGVVLLKSVLLQHRQLQLVEQQHQALWLAEAGLQRAAYQLRQSSDYRGEVWQIPADALGGSDAGIVTIQVELQDGDQKGWRVSVEACYPDDPVHRVMQRREQTVPATTESE